MEISFGLLHCRHRWLSKFVQYPNKYPFLAQLFCRLLQSLPAAFIPFVLGAEKSIDSFWFHRAVHGCEKRRTTAPAARKGDEAAFLLLFDSYEQVVFRFAYRMVGSKMIAQDIVQDCFLSLLRSPVMRFNGNQSSLKTFLYGIVRNMARWHLSRHGLEVPLEDLDKLPASANNDGINHLFRQEISAVVQHAVARLPLLQKESSFVVRV
jgi:RNA polymerase sigma factor (sigma-70 family)